MSPTVTAADTVPADLEVLGVPVFSDLTVPAGAPTGLDVAALARQGFKGKLGEAREVPGTAAPRLVALGMGERSTVTAESLRRAGAALVRKAWRDSRAATTVLAAAPALEVAEAARALAEGAAMASYRFTRYKSDPDACRLQALAVVAAADRASVEAGLARGTRVAEAVALARDVATEPAAAMTPRRLAEVATEIAEAQGLGISVLDEVAIVNEGLGGLAGVAQGSDEPARLIELVYDPPGAEGTLALVGKGITFDSGGLSIKTAEGMETMKTDKSGAAAVLGALSAVPALAPRVKVIGIIPTTENMSGGRALKPGDVLKIRNGKTVEVLNTDAEGRLVLADALSLAVEAHADAIVDVATLTGACVVALGRRVAGLMGNSDDWVAQVRGAAERAGEPVWPLPLPEEYRKQLDSEVADLKNISGGRYAGALTAALFLKEFVGGIPWAHLDIAGPARSEEEEGYLPKGATGFGVRTLLEVVAAFRPPPPT